MPKKLSKMTKEEMVRFAVDLDQGEKDDFSDLTEEEMREEIIYIFVPPVYGNDPIGYLSREFPGVFLEEDWL